MKTIKINVPLTVHYELLPPPVDGEAIQKRIESRWGAVSVAISGSRESVDHMLSVCPTNDPPTLIQRALSVLGYVVGDHEKDVAQFSRWVDHISEFPQSEEALELWTNATLARLHATRSVDEASKDAQAIVVQRMRLFPPAPETGLDDGPLIPEPWAELHEWRSAAKRCGIASAKELADTVSETFGQFVDRKVTRDWQEATGCDTPDVAKLRIGQLNRFLDEWRSKSGVASPDALVEKFRVTEDAWKEATGATDTHAAYKKIANLELQLVSYASEIDALRKSPKRDWDAELGLAGAEHKTRVAAERELAKVKAELDSKRRECQTEKERADKAEQDANNLRSIYSDARASAGLPPSIGEGENLSKWCQDAREARQEADTWKTEALTCGMTLVDIRSALESKFPHLGSFANVSWNEFGKKAVAAISSAIIPLPKPESVEPGQRWAFVMTCMRETSIASGLAIQFVDAGGCGYAAFEEDIASGFYLGK